MGTKTIHRKEEQLLEKVVAELKSKIRNIPDFPIPGILFRDITPLLQDPKAFKLAMETMASHYKNARVDSVVAIESRGYILGSALACLLGTGFIPVRKPGKLPFERVSESYTLEYGSNILEMHKDAVSPGQKILIVDDLIATGGSALATKKMVEFLGGKVFGFAFLIELKGLNGRKHLHGYDVFSLIEF